MSGIFNFLFNPQGRISRSDVWLKYLLPLIGISIVAAVLDTILFPGTGDILEDTGPLGMLVSLFYLWPGIAVIAKRFHDRGMTGWWVLGFPLIAAALAGVGVAVSLNTGSGDAFESPVTILLVIAAIIVLIVQFVINYVLPGEKGENKYGDDPLDPIGNKAEVFE